MTIKKPAVIALIDKFHRQISRMAMNSRNEVISMVSDTAMP